jgi:hypothetical protein
MTVSRLRDIPGIGVDQIGDAADAARDPSILRLENLDTDVPPPQVAVDSTHRAIDDDDVTEDRRVGPSNFAGERDMLRAFLDYHRATLAMKCEGLTNDDLRKQSAPPSTLSLLGLVRHMAEVERAWFRRVFEDHEAPMVWSDKIDFQAAYDASASTRQEAFAAWEAEVENSRRIEREAESLDVAGYQPRWPMPLLVGCELSFRERAAVDMMLVCIRGSVHLMTCGWECSPSG